MLLRTLSKAYGLAGVRIGYAVGPGGHHPGADDGPDPLQYQPRGPCDPAALDDEDFLLRSREYNNTELAFLRRGLAGSPSSLPLPDELHLHRHLQEGHLALRGDAEAGDHRAPGGRPKPSGSAPDSGDSGPRLKTSAGSSSSPEARPRGPRRPVNGGKGRLPVGPPDGKFDGLCPDPRGDASAGLGSAAVSRVDTTFPAPGRAARFHEDQGRERDAGGIAS